MASQITRLTVVYSTVYPDADQRKHQSSASLAFVCGIHRGPVNSPHKWPITREMFPFDDVIMNYGDVELSSNLQYLFYHGTKTIRSTCEDKKSRISNKLCNCNETPPGTDRLASPFHDILLTTRVILRCRCAIKASKWSRLHTTYYRGNCWYSAHRTRNRAHQHGCLSLGFWKLNTANALR